MLARMGEVNSSVRALAHPGARCWRSWFSSSTTTSSSRPGRVRSPGKLSDVAGLVVAPLLLGALLTLMRAPRAVPLALAATGAGFVLCKASTTGAAVTSAVWSLFGTPTIIRADPTDLFALPALYGAWPIQRAAALDAGAGWRRTVSVALGVALLPIGVLATSATSCAEWRGFTEVAVVAGDFPGVPHEEETRLAAYDGSGWLTIDRPGQVRPASRVRQWRAGLRRRPTAGVRRGSVLADRRRRRGGLLVRRRSQLAPGGRPDGSGPRRHHRGGGRRGVRGPVARDGPPTSSRPTSTESCRSIASLERGGVWRRNHDGTWTILTIDTIGELVERDRPPPPVVTELDPPRSPEVPDPSVPAGTPTPGCPSPTQRTVTPNPLNGPPTTYDVCP